MRKASEQRLNVAVRLYPVDVDSLRELAFRDGKTPGRYAAEVIEAHLTDVREKRVEAEIKQG